MKLRSTFPVLLIGLLVSLVVLGFGMAGLGDWSRAKFAGWFVDSGIAQLEGWIVPPAWVGGVAVILVALLVAWVAMRVARPRKTWVFAVGVAVLGLGASVVLALYGILFEPIGVAVVALLAWLIAVLRDGSEAGKRRRMFREQLAGRVSPETMAKLEASPFGAKLGGQSRGVTALAVRVLDEGRLRDNLGAGRAVDVANLLLDRAAEFLIGREAYLEERAPGGVRCSFGLPLADDEHSAIAVRAALALRDELEQYSAQIAAEFGERPGWGIGLACGEATVGLFGEGRFQRFGALGPQPEVAWEMAGANADYGSAVLVASSTYSSIGTGGEFRPIAMLPGAGGAPEEIYELIAAGGELGEMGVMRRDAFWRGIVRMRAGDHAAAKQEFLDARTPGVEDRALEHFIAKIGAELARGPGGA